MSLLQDVLRSHATDTLDKRLSNSSISQRTQLNLDKDDSDDELINVVRLSLGLLPISDFCAYRYQYQVLLLAHGLRHGRSRPRVGRSTDLHLDPYILACHANYQMILSRCSQ